MVRKQVSKPAAIEKDRATDEGGPMLPAGFEDFALDASSVDWREEDHILGRVIGGDTLITENGARRVLFVLSEGAPRMVWENAQLRRLFDQLRHGDDVYIRATGTVKLENGRSMRTFKAAIRRGKGDRPVFTGRPGRGLPEGVGDEIPF